MGQENSTYRSPLGVTNVGGFDPKDLGWDLPGMTRIYLKGCGGLVNPHAENYNSNFEWDDTKYLSSGPGAHTHVTKTDPLYRSVCFKSERFYIEKIVWHEYGHVLDVEHHFGIGADGVGTFFSQDAIHTGSYLRIMEMLGKEEATKPLIEVDWGY